MALSRACACVLVVLSPHAALSKRTSAAENKQSTREMERKHQTAASSACTSARLARTTLSSIRRHGAQSCRATKCCCAACSRCWSRSPAAPLQRPRNTWTSTPWCCCTGAMEEKAGERECGGDSLPEALLAAAHFNRATSPARTRCPPPAGQWSMLARAAPRLRWSWNAASDSRPGPAQAKAVTGKQRLRWQCASPQPAPAGWAA